MVGMLALLNIGFPEMLLLAAAAVMLFGGDLPDVARKAARFVGKLRSLSQDLTRELNMPDDLTRPPPELRRPPELDLSPEEREVLHGPMKLSPRPPFENTPDNPVDAELGPARDATEGADDVPRDPAGEDMDDGDAAPAGATTPHDAPGDAAGPAVTEAPPTAPGESPPGSDSAPRDPAGPEPSQAPPTGPADSPARAPSDPPAGPGAGASDDERPRHPDDPA